MEIINVIDNPDGSATLEIDMNEEEMRLLMEAGLNKVLKDYLEEMKHAPIINGTGDGGQKKKNNPE